MKLIAKKPCSFGGKDFFINDEIPVNAVLNPKQQEELGVLSIVSDGEAATGILETGFQETDIAIPVFKSYDGDTAQVMGIPLNAGEIQEVFSIMQMNVEEATKAIEAAKSENMLIVIHACDSRAGVKKAAQKKADNLSSTNGSTNDPAGSNEFVDHSTQDETPSGK